MLFKFLSLFLVLAPMAVFANEPVKSEAVNHKLVTAEQLKTWYDQNTNMIVLDARTQPYFDGNLLPKSVWLPCDTTDELIAKEVPTKDALVVVYCASTQCPASGWLYDKLSAMGYTNVFEYHEGIQDWKNHGYPIVQK